MNLREFKNTKTVATIGVLLPLIILSVVYFIWGDVIDPNGGGTASNLFFTSTSVVLILYAIFTFFSFKSMDMNIFPFAQKIIHSDYGNFFLLNSEKALKNIIVVMCTKINIGYF